MRRREFLPLLGAMMVARPLSAEQKAMPVIGLLSVRSPDEAAGVVAAFHQGLAESGYVERQNVAIEYRWAEGQYDRLPALVADLVNLIASGGGASAVLAAKAATTTIPIVFSAGGDPVGLGLVASLNRPGGNITGVWQYSSGLEAKRLGLLNETSIAVLNNPNFADAENQLRDVQEAAARLGVQLVIVRANTESDFDAAFSTLVRQRS